MSSGTFILVSTELATERVLQKNRVLKILQHTSVLESLFDKVAGL